MTEPLILAIESSCDDTAASVLRGFEVLSNVRHTQVDHAKYGGVVPEIASRQHVESISAIVDQALTDAQVATSDLGLIAVTQGPGLLGSLLVGHNFAKSMAMALNIPFVNVHHMHGHMLACMLTEKGIQDQPMRDFPFLALTVSGGHTQIVQVSSATDMLILGETMDDAVGEAFDKAAKILSLPYPGGPEIDQRAQSGNAERFTLSSAAMPNLNFSYSGLKTNIIQAIQRRQKQVPDTMVSEIHDWCASIQCAMVAPLIAQLKLAQQQTGISRVVLAGGVAANSQLRNDLQQWALSDHIELYLPPMSYTTDNAAMIGAAGWAQYLESAHGQWHDAAQAKLPIS